MVGEGAVPYCPPVLDGSVYLQILLKGLASAAGCYQTMLDALPSPA